MRRLSVLTLACCTALGCTDPPLPCDATHVLDGVADVVPIPEGGRAFIDDPPAGGTAGVDVVIEGLAPGFSVRTDEHTFVVHAPYGVVGSIPVHFVATCTDATHHTAARAFSLEVRGPRVHVLGDESGPSPRSLAAATVVGNALLVAGGVSVDPSSPSSLVAKDDVWSLDLASGAWTALDLTAPPSPSRAATLDDHRALLLARDGRSFVVDVAASSVIGVAVDGTAAAPSDVERGAFAFAGGAFVSLCGAAAGGVGVDTRCHVSSLVVDAQNRGAWTPEEPTGFSPAGRAGAAFGVDDEGARMVLFGGARDDGPGHDTWSLDDSGVGSGDVTFGHLAEKGDDPPARVDACGVVDPAGRRFYVFGGTGDPAQTGGDDVVVADPWVLDLETADAKWRPVHLEGLPARAGCTAVYDDAHDRLLVGFGKGADGEHGDVYAIDL